MVGCLIHVYKKGAPPFRTLSDLPESEAVSIMSSLYVEGSIFWERFADPSDYLGFRQQVERNLRAGFLAKGGKPKLHHPIYFMLGRPPWTIEHADPATLATTDEVELPLSIFDPEDISFTYPDSMVSALIARERDPAYFEPELHGKVFTLSQIEEITAQRGVPGEQWKTKMPERLAHYIEAQVWNRVPIDLYCGTV